MKFRLEKAEEGVPFVDIPVGHVAIDRSTNERALRTSRSVVFLPKCNDYDVSDVCGNWVDLGPLNAEQQPEPKRVPFADIPMGHVGVSAGLRVLRTSDGGVFLQNESLGRHQPLTEFGMLYEDLGKLVVEEY